MIPDIFPFGIAFERLAAQMTGGTTIENDQHHLADVGIHMDTYREHVQGAEMARARGDLYNAFVEQSDALINKFFAAIVAARITDPALRAQAFALVNAPTTVPVL